MRRFSFSLWIAASLLAGSVTGFLTYWLICGGFDVATGEIENVSALLVGFAVGLATCLGMIFWAGRATEAAIAELGRCVVDVLQRRAVAVPPVSGPGEALLKVSQPVGLLAAALQARAEQSDLFAREMAHELKSPLTSLRSAVETAGRISDPEQHRNLMSVIVQDVARLDRLISAITDLSQVEAELAAMPDEQVDVAAMIAAIVEIENAANRSEFDPRFSTVEGGGPFLVRGVDTRLAQVFRNVLSNARSFSPPGAGVRFALARKGDTITVTCDDDGPGVPAGKEEEIFDRFYSDRPADQPFEGHSGLGLALCRQILAAHGGAIWVENRVDTMGRIAGARFIMLLPAAAKV